MASVGLTRKKQTAEVDIISKLPDSLISHILSCLPTKDAVRTSLLSKRWIACWTLINKVNIDEDHNVLCYSRNSRRKKSSGNQHFINFVYKSLLLIEKVESFTLFITSKYDATLINAWIYCILIRRPKKFHIRINSELSFSTHTSQYLFNHTYNLEELVLEMCAIKVAPNRVGYFSFGYLKVIKLCGIIFTIDESLVIRLSVLKKFETENCYWLSAHDVTIEAPLLENVFILIEQDSKSITRETRSCKIKFTASCIKEFTYRGYGGISQPIVLSNSSAARNASVNIILPDYWGYVQETESCAFILLKQFSEVKFIKFNAFEVLTQPNVAVLPNFAMLSHLELGTVSCEVLLGLLQKTPVLSTLFFEGISKFEQELLNSTIVPDCLTSTLQVVKFENVHGFAEHELILAKYLMENGMALERMSFSLANAELSKSNVVEEFKEKLYSFKKGVSFAILEFCY